MNILFVSFYQMSQLTQTAAMWHCHLARPGWQRSNMPWTVSRLGMVMDGMYLIMDMINMAIYGYGMIWIYDDLIWIVHNGWRWIYHDLTVFDRLNSWKVFDSLIVLAIVHEYMTSMSDLIGWMFFMPVAGPPCCFRGGGPQHSWVQAAGFD